MKWYLDVIIKNYATFSGRARRKEFWMFVLFNFLILFALTFLIDFIDDLIGGNEVLTFVIFIYLLGMIIPTLGVISRRLHDTGKSGTYFLVYFIPFIGGIWLLILLTSEGDRGFNKYGPDPKANNNFDEIDDIGKPLSEN
ncbi:DUF805 domain-containing protein [Flavivirga aquimarina]|uniref:DUF805 domain-containing protein n=1 Tax=Flavivirga aquimarina TaxID=2027862 RepID=A0ABT8W7C7_9FLAO|nr:DUF805 domain-containing protein [Flavivirga aquimarina]MDO5969025.1 DUF805 domain-containing protein [Flavivirga aquimarina]